MGIAWCRERVEQAQNAKSPVDRILVRCSNMIKPRSPYSHSQGKIVNDFVYKGMRSKNLGISPPVPIHAVPPRTRNRTQKTSDWQTCTLSVPDTVDLSKPPIPPPRKKRKRKLNSAEVLNSQLPELHSPSYVIYSENLLNRNLANLDSVKTNEIDVFRPMEKSHHRERTSGYDRFGKLSGNRTRKIKTESHHLRRKDKEENGRNSMEQEKVKNDSGKKTEQKMKHFSTVSLVNYNELVKPARKVQNIVENGDDKTGNQSGGLKHRRNSSTISLPGEGSNSILSSLSEVTIHRLEAYMKRCRSFGSLKPQQLLEKLEEFNKTHRSASESSDSWSGLDDWDLGVIEYCDSETNAPPLTPKSRLPTRTQRVSFYQGDCPIPPKRRESNDSNTKKEPVIERPVDPDIQSSKTPIMMRCESYIEGVPLEWFLEPRNRPLAIMPPPKPEKFTKTPPPSPEGEKEEETEKEEPKDEHCTLLNILRQYKEEESDQPEVHIDVEELVELDLAGEKERDAIVFEGIDLEVPSKLDQIPLPPLKDRANSMTEEQCIILRQEKERLRSPSVGFESSTHLLKQLQTNKDAIEKVIFLKPNEFADELRKEDLCGSLPEDAFEVFINKRKPSLRESLNEFLGFKKPEEDIREKVAGQEGDSNKKDEKGDAEKASTPPPPPLPASPPPSIVITSNDASLTLVTSKDNKM